MKGFSAIITHPVVVVGMRASPSYVERLAHWNKSSQGDPGATADMIIDANADMPISSKPLNL